MTRPRPTPPPHLALRLVLLLGTLGVVVCAPPAAAGEAVPPKGRALGALVEAYLDADEAGRAAMRKQSDTELAPLDASQVPALRKALLKAASRHGPRIGRSGTQYFFEKPRGKYIVSGKPSKTLFIGLHGGGAGSGDAGSAAGAMGGGGWWWIYPEVLEKTEHGWTDSGTEQFVMDLVEAAKRTGKVDPNRIYISGHSMGGYGSWTLGAHHADVFAGIGPYAGAPTCVKNEAGTIFMVQPGILPNLFNIPLHVYQSGDDKNVPPASNDFAVEALRVLDKRWPDGFTFRYDRVEGRAHAAPADGYLPSQRWLASHPRNPRPRAFLWQPVLPWKRQFYWVYWERAEMEAWIEVRALEGNRVEITTHEGTGDVTGLSVLLGPPLVDLDAEVEIRVNGKEAFRGLVRRTFSTLLLTLPRNDPDLLFDARVDLVAD